jgi:hypothetical protein
VSWSLPFWLHTRDPCQRFPDCHHNRSICLASLFDNTYRSHSVRKHLVAYASIRQHPSAYVSIRQHTSEYVRIRQHTSAYVSIHAGGTVFGIRQHTPAYVSIRQHTSAYVSIRQHTSAYVSIDAGGTVIESTLFRPAFSPALAPFVLQRQRPADPQVSAFVLLYQKASTVVPATQG